MNSILIQAAKEYSDLGLSVIPVKEDKSPTIRWAPFQKRRMTNGEIVSNFSNSFTTGIGVICGSISGNFEVVDVDLKNDKSGTLGIEIKQAIHDNLPELYNTLVVSQTKNNGLHFYFQCDKIERNQVLAKNEEREVIIETRGEGGMVNVPPTEGYHFISKNFSSTPTISEDTKEIFYSILRSFDQSEVIETNDEGIYGYENDENSPFYDYNQKTDVPEFLVKHNWSKVRQIGDRVYFKRPGKEGNSVSANWHLKKRVFFPFTTSTEFQAGKGYSATGVFTVLECDGDFYEASRKLSEMGFGNQVNKETKENLPPTPPFPIDGFPEFIQNFINTCHEVFQTPLDFWAGAAIATIAFALGNKFELVGKYRNFPIFWLNLVGVVSSGKSEAMRLCLEPFKMYDDKLMEQFKDDKVNYDLISNLSPEERENQGYGEILMRPKLKQNILSDSTPEAMVEAHEANKKILIYRDELKGMFDDYGRYAKSGEQSNMISYWSGISANTHRKSGVVRLTDPVIHILGGMQPGLLNTLKADDRAENGFLARMCFVYPDHSQKPELSDEVVPEELKKEWENFILALTKIEEKVEFTLSSEAKEEYRIWYKKNRDLTNNEPSGYIQGIYGKLDIISLRLALVLKGMKWILEGDIDNTISGDIMKSAIEITEYFRATALKVYRKIFYKDGRKLTKKEIVIYLFEETELNKLQIATHLNMYRMQVQRWTKGLTKKKQ